MLKYNFESNSQQPLRYAWIIYVGNYMLKYNFESNSQLDSPNSFFKSVGNYMLKYNFESNSQLALERFAILPGWELYAKVQF